MVTLYIIAARLSDKNIAVNFVTLICFINHN